MHGLHAYRGCRIGSGTCTQPDSHSSLSCYERYFELAWEGSRAPQPMSVTEWLEDYELPMPSATEIRREACKAGFVPPFIATLTASELIAEHTGRIEYQEGN